MEVSSHALEQGRAEAVRFAGAVFTNLTQDHLDYHHDMESYLAAKKKLFDGLDGAALAVYNIDDEAGERMTSHTLARRVSFGQSELADIRFEVLESRLDVLQIRLDGRKRMFRLPGRFNAYNVSAAYAVLSSLGYGAVEVLNALEQVRPAPGRFEAVTLPGGPIVVVDYAHTPDALENVLRAIAECKPDGARVWCIFGCGGDRDRAKRPMMARIAEEGADQVVVTDDNPRTEPSEQIFADMRPGFRDPDRVIWQRDRRLAIAAALEGAAPGDVVLVAGKGHEGYQVIGTEKIDFDDREVIREIWVDPDRIKPS
jgi:UDP-N-acetylmuramoyl-L-alanyl-D-glutamate--2,6-diaminopimelate ligase